MCSGPARPGFLPGRLGAAGIAGLGRQIGACPHPLAQLGKLVCGVNFPRTRPIKKTVSATEYIEFCRPVITGSWVNSPSPPNIPRRRPPQSEIGPGPSFRLPFKERINRPPPGRKRKPDRPPPFGVTGMALSPSGTPYFGISVPTQQTQPAKGKTRDFRAPGETGPPRQKNPVGSNQ